MSSPAAPSRQQTDEYWGRSAAPGEVPDDPGDLRRIATIAEMCPVVDSLLDVGCGNGDVLRALAEHRRSRRSYGCDLSAVGVGVAKSHGQDPPRVVQGSADHLPFADRAFELVLCCDVLEHLPEPVALGALREIMRVAGRYVLINLPLEGDMSWQQLYCPACGQIFHRDHHMRSYGRQQVLDMLPAAEFRVVAVRSTGWTVRHPLPLPPRLGAWLGLGHDDSLRCVHCGARPGPLPPVRRLLRNGFVFTHNAMTRPLRRWLSRDTEIVVLFSRA